MPVRTSGGNTTGTSAGSRSDSTRRKSAANGGTERSEVVFKPAQPRRAFDEIISQIKAMIQDGTLKSGDRLPSERALADQFAVSRNTVREALRMLEIAGLVKLRRGASGGSFIADADPGLVADSLSNALHLTDVSLADITETMQGISTMAAVSAVQRMSDEDLERLDANVKKAAEMTRAGQWDEKVETHLQFHVLLAEATRNPILVFMMKSLVEVVGPVIIRVGPTQDDSIVRARQGLMRALRARDSESAVKELDKYFHKLHKMWLSGGYDGGRP